MKKRILTALLALALALPLPAVSARAYEERTVSDGCVEFIKAHEGFSDTVYGDSTGYYIGYGCYVDPAEYPDGLTQEQAEALLRENLGSFAEYVNDFLRRYDISVTQSQFDALVSMTFNFGPSWLTTENRLPSYLVKGVGNYSDREVVEAFAAWCHLDGAANENLLERRIAEAKMFLYGDYSFDVSDWRWLIMDLGGGDAVSDVACYRLGVQYETLPTAERAGYTLSGWRREDGAMLDSADIVTENLRVSAVWTKNGGETDPETGKNEPEPAVESRFADVPLGSWYCDYVNDLASRGVINGYPDGTFLPGENVSRAQALKLILLAAGYPAKEPEEGGHWASGYLAFAEERGFVAEGAWTDLDAFATRAEIASLAAKALELTAQAAQTPFADTADSAVIALYEAGIIEGSFENGQRVYRGGSCITRAEISAIVWRIADYVDENLILFSSWRLPRDKSLPRNPYDEDAFYTQGTRVYYGGEGFDVRYGIDVSFYQGDIDWTAVKNDGIDFAIIRAGYRGCSEGTLNEDERFREYIEGALSAGVEVGLYFFSQAVNAEEAREEARYILELASGYNVTWPIVFDWEPLSYSYSRTNNFDYSVLTDCAIAFCDTINAAGYTGMVYLNETFAYLRYDVARLYGQYPIWLAHYAEKTDYAYDFQIWQYGSSGSVAGISGRVDMDIAFVDLTK